MAKDPAFPFYASDWLGSNRRACMTMEQQAAYMNLLCRQWTDSTCSLPDDDDILATMSGMCEGWFANGSSVLRECFPPHPHLDGRIANSRLLELRAERDAWVEKSRKGGLRSGRVRKLGKHPKFSPDEVLLAYESNMRDGDDANGPCVYLLLKSGTVVYVGQSQRLRERIKEHKSDGIVFDAVKWTLAALDRLEHVERGLIAKYQPMHNKRGMPVDTKGGSQMVGTKPRTKCEPNTNTPSPSSFPSPSPSSSPLSSPSPDAKGSIKTEPLSASADRSADIRSVFAHYKKYHPRAHPKPASVLKEWKLIRARLEDGYTATDLCQAIDGCHLTPHNLGVNPRDTKYLGLTVIMKDGSNVSRFMDAAENPPKPQNEKERRSVDAIQRWLEKGSEDA